MSVLNTNVLYEYNGEPFCSFYTLSLENNSDPFYISETITSSNSCHSPILTFDSNLMFQDLNLNRLKNNDARKYNDICNLKQFYLRVYINMANNKKCQWRLIKLASIDLGSLLFVDNLNLFLSNQRSVLDGKRIDNIIFLDLIDGSYIVPEISIDDLYQDLLEFLKRSNGNEADDCVEADDTSEAKDIEEKVNLTIDLTPLNGSKIISFDRILKLDNLKLCINDIEKINRALTYEIEQKVEGMLDHNNKNKEFSSIGVQSKALRHRIALMNKCITAQQNKTIKLKNELLQKKRYLNALKHRVQENVNETENENENINEIENLKNGNNYKEDDPDLWKIFMRSDSYERNNKLLHLYLEKQKNELSRIFKGLLEMFEIIPVTKNPIEFQILGYSLSKLHYFISFPNYENCHEYDDVTLLYKNTHIQDEIDTALGYAAQLIDLIAQYLQVPLKYPILKLGSHSYIRDNISDMLANKRRNDIMAMQYPLFINTGQIAKFEFGLRLLLQDLQLLLDFLGLTVPDKWNLLGNLKMVMLYCASFKSDMSEQN